MASGGQPRILQELLQRKRLGGGELVDREAGFLARQARRVGKCEQRRFVQERLQTGAVVQEIPDAEPLVEDGSAP